jgi:hypothetical protein
MVSANKAAATLDSEGGGNKLSAMHGSTTASARVILIPYLASFSFIFDRGY